MSDGRWGGGAANRNWARPGSRLRLTGDRERSARLAEDLADKPFLDEVCGRVHPLGEYQQCRQGQ